MCYVAWPASLESYIRVNASLEGEICHSNQSLTPTSRITNRCQILVSIFSAHFWCVSLQKSVCVELTIVINNFILFVHHGSKVVLYVTKTKNVPRKGSEGDHEEGSKGSGHGKGLEGEWPGRRGVHDVITYCSSSNTSLCFAVLVAMALEPTSCLR